jgi:hypothetical protein
MKTPSSIIYLVNIRKTISIVIHNIFNYFIPQIIRPNTKFQSFQDILSFEAGFWVQNHLFQMRIQLFGMNVDPPSTGMM